MLETGQLSTVSVTDDRVAYPKRWIAAVVGMNGEKKASTLLRNLGIEHYVPLQTEIHQWSDRRKKVTRIVIPMVIFLHVSEIEEHQVIRHSFIYKLLKYPGAKGYATVIPDEQIETLKFLLGNSTTPVSFSPTLKPGDSIRVFRGPLTGLTGTVSEDDGSDFYEIQCPMPILGATTVKVHKSEVERV